MNKTKLDEETEIFKAKILESKQTFFPHHNCAICGYGVGYVVRDGVVYFDPGCGCSKYVYHPDNISPVSWEELRIFMKINKIKLDEGLESFKTRIMKDKQRFFPGKECSVCGVPEAYVVLGEERSEAHGKL